MSEFRPRFEKAVSDDIWPTIFAELGLAEEGREAQVVRLVMEFHTDKAIARRLGLASKTAGRYVSRLMHRVGARSRAELVARVLQIQQSHRREG